MFYYWHAFCLVPKLRLGMPTLQALLAVCDKINQNIKQIQSWDVAVIKYSMKPIRHHTLTVVGWQPVFARQKSVQIYRYKTRYFAFKP